MDILNRKAIKRDARAFIDADRRWLNMGLTCLPLILLTSALEGGGQVAQQFSNNENSFNFSFSFGTGFLAWLLIPFTVAMAGFYLNYLRNNNSEWKSLYMEGIDRYGKYFVVGLVTEIIIALWTLLLIVPGIIKSLEYFFVHHIIHDNPNLDQKQARELSKRMTDGFKDKLCIMVISFIPWIILEIFTFGIASIYVTPYMECTKAMYYENLKHNAIVNGIATPAEFGIAPIVEEPIYNNFNATTEEAVAENVEEINPDDTNTEI